MSWEGTSLLDLMNVRSILHFDSALGVIVNYKLIKDDGVI